MGIKDVTSFYIALPVLSWNTKIFIAGIVFYYYHAHYKLCTEHLRYLELKSNLIPDTCGCINGPFSFFSMHINYF